MTHDGYRESYEFVLDENKLSLKATDPSQISMVDFVLEKKAFKEYEQFNKTQKIYSDFDRFSKNLLEKKNKALFGDQKKN